MSENDQGLEREYKDPEPLVVITTVASFADNKRGIKQRLKPIRILRQSGQTHRVRKVHNWHDEPVGHGHKHVHFTLVTEDDRRLDIVFDTRKIGWFLVNEEASMMLD